MKYSFSIILVLLFVCAASYGQYIAEEPLKNAETTFINIPTLSSTLSNAPKADNVATKSEGLIMEIPIPGNSRKPYYVFENNLLSLALKTQFPSIKTYTLYSAEKNSFEKGCLTASPFGMFALLFTSKGIIEIRPENWRKTGIHKVQYQDQDYLDCQADQIMNTKSLPNEGTLSTLKNFSFPSGDLLRTYRLAIATTGEFYQTNAAGILDMGQADMAVTTVIANLVNGVQNIYFDELAMAFELIPPLLFRDPLTDPFDPSTSMSRRNLAQTVIEANLDPGTYDIGHVFNYWRICTLPIRGFIDGSEDTFNGTAVNSMGNCAPIWPDDTLNFKVISFRVDVTGDYTFDRTPNTTFNEGIAIMTEDFDSDAPSPCDDFLGASRELDMSNVLTPDRNTITVNLTQNTWYRLVVFNAILLSTGTYEIEVNGPGTLGGNCQFSSGGQAGRAVCDDSSKARGWSSTPDETQTGRFIRLAAHEIGHQFGTKHTFNGDGDNCTSNIVDTAAYEIASGTTIMSYRGICSDDQNIGDLVIDMDPDLYFHTHSLREIIYFVNTEATCPAFQVTGNIPPVADANPTGNAYVIPGGTPFELTGSGTDANNDPLTYTWEQYNEDGLGTPTQGLIGTDAGANPLAPLFRSFPPSSSPSRTFPVLDSILDNQNIAVFEALPTVTRILTFRLTTRDHNPNGGGVACDDINLVVDGSTGPFRVTSPNIDACLVSGTMQTITWDVANTDGGSVNCSDVDILLSVDGGLTFPYDLAIGVPNDGTQDVMLPDMVRTLEGRIKIACSDNIFFDINDEDIVIECPGLLIVSDNPAEGIYRAGSRIETSGPVVVNNNTEFLAGELILLRDGFLAQMNPFQTFLARIQPCDPCLLLPPASGPIVNSRAKKDKEEPTAYNRFTPKDEPLQHGAKVYPNPFSDYFIVEFQLSQDSPVKIELYDVTGKMHLFYKREHLSMGIHQISLDGSQLWPGIYYCLIKTKSGKVQAKLVRIQ